MNRVEQYLFADGLAQEANGSRLQGALLFLLACSGTNEDDGNPVAKFRQPLLKFQTTHSRHTHVEQKAGCLGEKLGTKELLGGTKGLGSKAGPAKQPQGGNAHQGVVVHDRDQRPLWAFFPRLRLLLLRQNYLHASKLTPGPGANSTTPSSRLGHCTLVQGRTGLRRVGDAKLFTHSDQLGEGFGAHFLHDMAAMKFDGSFGSVKFAGNLFVQ